MVVLIAAVVLLIVSVGIWWVCCKPRIDPVAESCAAFDAAFSGDDSQLDRVKHVSRPGFAAAMAFKSKHGELRYNNANRMVAGAFVRGYIAEHYHDMRDCDKVRHAMIGEQLALTPTVAAMESTRYAEAPCVRERRAAYTAPR